MNTNQYFIFLIGLPGSGKSTWLDKNNEFFMKNTVILSADKIKDRIWKSIRSEDQSYNDFCEKYHKESTQMIEEIIYDHINKRCNVILDGGGINQSYNLRIISKIREINPEIKISAIYFDTPINICLERIKLRERKVPIEDIYRKNQMLPAILNKYRQKGIEIEIIPYFTDKYVFFDMDGVICSINDPVFDINGDLDFVNTEFFKNSSINKQGMDKFKYFANIGKTSRLFILTACANNMCLDDKTAWVIKYLPELNKNNFLWVGNKDFKHVFLRQYLLGKKIEPRDVLYIDDNFEMLTKMRDIGVHTKHVSQL
jgi:predicted kinase